MIAIVPKQSKLLLMERVCDRVSPLASEYLTRSFPTTARLIGIRLDIVAVQVHLPSLQCAIYQTEWSCCAVSAGRWT
jgi:uncharacterized protein VirK/YbjX